MSMYNLMFSTNMLAGPLLAMLGVRTSDCGRFRDCYLQREGEELVVHVLTRNGGGNRPEYETVTEFLRRHSWFMRDFDDDFDATYALYVFRIPDQHRGRVEEAVRASPELVPTSFAERMQALRNFGKQSSPSSDQPAVVEQKEGKD